MNDPGEVVLDGSHGEGGGQVLRTALTLALVTGRRFRIEKIRENRSQPGLRPQHCAAVRAATRLGHAEVEGDEVGSRVLTFAPKMFEPRDLEYAIGTAGSTALVLHTLHPPMALGGDDRPRTLTVTGGTFNDKAPSYPFLEWCWATWMTRLGWPVAVRSPRAGFFPRGGGELVAKIGRASPRSLLLTDRGVLEAVTIEAGVARLGPEIARRMARRARVRLEGRLPDATTCDESIHAWDAPSPGAAVMIHARFEHAHASFVCLGERGFPSEKVADRAVEEFLEHLGSDGAVDVHSADQILLPLALAPGRSAYTVSAVSEHLRTNARTIGAFLDREIVVSEAEDGRPGSVAIRADGSGSRDWPGRNLSG